MKRMLSPGSLALALGTLITCLWVIWGVPEMFHEGWYAAFDWAFFLLPGGVMLSLCLVALRWPRLGAFVYTAIGLGFGVFVLWQYRPGGGRSAGWTLANVLSWLPVTLFLVVVGVLFYVGRREYRPAWHYLAAICVPVLLGVALGATPAYRVFQRVDDGFLGERLIEGNGVALHWAPAGPGWGRTGGVSWNQIALYGKGNVAFEGKRFGLDGLCNGSGDWAGHCATAEDMRSYNVCLYLNREGTELMPVRQSIWRMPTTDEIVRSLVRDGSNAGCTWDVAAVRVACAGQPDKETPLWDPKSPVIYYWTAEEAGPGEAYVVVYNGQVWAVSRFTALGSRGYRCVRE